MHVPVWPVLPDSTLAPHAVLEKFRVHALAGLGVETCDESGCYDIGTVTSSDPVVPFQPISDNSSLDLSKIYEAPPAAWTGLPQETIQTNVGPQTGVVMPQSSSAAWAVAAAQLMKAGMTLAQINAIQPGTVVSANGAILRQNPGYGVPVSQTGLSVKTNANTTVLIGAAAVIAAMFFFSQRR